MLRKMLLLSLLLLLTTAVAVQAQDTTPEATDAPMMATAEAGPAPDLITINSPGLFPEGIEWDPFIGKFLVGSLSQGTIHAVSDDGTLEPFIENENLVSTVGIEVDEARNRLFVTANNVPSLGEGSAALGAYDSTTGEELFFTDLGAQTPNVDSHFANDVAVDNDGFSYVTDSFAGVIYMVDRGGDVIVWLDDPSFKGQFTLNGIDYNPAGFLVAVRGDGLIKIPIDNPQAFTPIEVDADLSGADGINFIDDVTLAVVANSQQTVYLLNSADRYETAEVVGSFESEEQTTPTTAAVRDGEVFLVDAKLREMGSDTPPDEFTIVKAVFEE